MGLIPRLIQHARKTKATGTIIAPCWPSVPLWPLLFPEAGLPASGNSKGQSGTDGQ